VPYRLKIVPLLVAAACVLLQANAAQAIPFSLSTCVTGDCAALDLSGGGTIEATLDIVNSNDLLITLTNSLNSDADGDAPFVQRLGFIYDGSLAGVTIGSVTVLSGTVSQPSLTLNQNLTSFNVDFGFNFENNNGPGRFQALNPDEVIQILVTTTGVVDPSLFTNAVAQIGGIGPDGDYSATISAVPEPTTLALMSVAGFGAFLLRRRRSS
jgi:PEP-CTERM motif